MKKVVKKEIFVPDMEKKLEIQLLKNGTIEMEKMLEIQRLKQLADG